MDHDTVERALYQTLRQLQRTGLRRLPRRPAGQPVPEWVEALNHALDDSATGDVAAPDDDAPHANATSAGGGRGSANHSGAVEKGAGQSRAEASQSAGDRPSLVVPDRWTLPVLDDDERRERLSEVNSRVRACRRCAEIVHYRRQTVFGEGPLRPTVCFMGEAPGADEDRLGRPFVGRAGQLLTKIIQAMKLRREDVYILNALKCRPPHNRTPTAEEIENCHEYVEAQLEILQPNYIVCLGAVAVRSLLGQTTSIGRMRGRWYQYKGAKVVVTYHPSYLLRNESAKRLVWEDMKMVMRDLGIPV